MTKDADLLADFERAFRALASDRAPLTEERLREAQELVIDRARELGRAAGRPPSLLADVREDLLAHVHGERRGLFYSLWFCCGAVVVLGVSLVAMLIG